jgi:hypothetical protein
LRLIYQQLSGAGGVRDGHSTLRRDLRQAQYTFIEAFGDGHIFDRHCGNSGPIG